MAGAGGMVSGAINGALGTVGLLFGAVAGMKADKKLSKLQKTDPVYEASPYAGKQMGLASSILNARMPGASNLEKNIQASQANSLDSVGRNATDSATALAMASGLQGQTNQSMADLQTREAMDYQNRYQNYERANQGMTEEYTKAFDDKVRRWQDQVNILMAQNAMRQKGAQSFIDFGASMGSSIGGAMPTGG